MSNDSESKKYLESASPEDPEVKEALHRFESHDDWTETDGAMGRVLAAALRSAWVKIEELMGQNEGTIFQARMACIAERDSLRAQLAEARG